MLQFKFGIHSKMFSIQACSVPWILWKYILQVMWVIVGCHDLRRSKYKQSGSTVIITWKPDLDPHPTLSSMSRATETMSGVMMGKLKRIQLFKNARQFDNQTCFVSSLFPLTHSMLRPQCFRLPKGVRIIFPETSRPVLGPI